MDIFRRNNIKILGEGKPILFSHGFGCDQSVWRFVAPAFESTHKVILFDHVGSGNSDLSSYASRKYDSLSTYADDVNQIIEYLRLEEVTFVGHSVSAMIGMLAAISRPQRFSRLIMVAPSASYIDDGSYVGGFKREKIESLLANMNVNFQDWARSVGPFIMGNPERPELGDELAQYFCRTDESVAKDFARVTFLTDSRNDLKKLSIKTLVLQSDEDDIALESAGRFVADHIPGSSFVKLKARGHCAHMSAPQEVIRAIKAFL